MNTENIAKKLSFDNYLRTQVVFALDTFVSVCASLGVILLLLLTDITFTTGQMVTWLGCSLFASVVSLCAMRIYRAIIRYSTLRELGRMCGATILKDIMLWTGMVAFGGFSVGSGMLFGMVLIDFMITTCALLLVRVCMVVIYDMIRSREKVSKNIRRVLIYGIGDKAAALVPRLRNSPHYDVAGFVTYGARMKGHLLSGLPVYYFNNEADVKEVARRSDVDGILFAYAADARAEQDRLINYAREAGLRAYIAPGIDELAEGAPIGAQIRKIKIEDLLGRPEIKISMEEIIANFHGKVVMVTGAAGSIGSELCRQLATFGVKRLVLVDNAETPLHNIRLELEDTFPELDFVPVIGDVRSQARLDFVFRHYKPQVVFHAAAYKHVPLMEENPCEAVRVNVEGSRNVADKCIEYDVEKMVMISTDKAVNPTNIMGCTKRLAEIYVQSLGLAIESGQIKGKTKFVTTRFGNVLGSNGSVIPRFRDQIEHGGPITVTHPEIRRFFMTIPEACRLVMEAATFSTGPLIFFFFMFV